MKKQSLAVVTLALGLLVLSGCGKKQTSNQDKVFKTTAQANVITVDPNRATDVGSYLAINQVLEGLYKQNNQGKIVPSVATKIVKPTNHGKTYTFTLRKTAKWNDGKRVTAYDFVNSARRQVEPKTKSQRAGHLSDLVNYTKMNTGKLTPKRLGIKALGNDKLQMSEPRRPLLQLCHCHANLSDRNVRACQMGESIRAGFIACRFRRRLPNS
ncbi:hypothetical protein HMPREF9103_00721 [Lentilactobacillus parafarraginis F0439]|uniref:Solute-binding protein family 5 domain-containing protein n=1 Tax=Lentilactobacillus parafarraginis F0439 TaxID=797515 RepID=G9ZLX3_9LACO|nr:ABC transporter substrate-binding protein [Lentilactobacillus parafarraginis]EHM00206.1 hypothetical protein HMPREF9103_00721 [Lentilactobacillus parafarraginis F0439]